MPGNPLGSLCSVCNDPLAAAINQQLIDGVGANTIAKRFSSVSLDSIKRHRHSGHHTRSIAALAVAVPAEKAAILGERAAITAATLIDKSAVWIERADAAFKRAEASGNPNDMIKAIGAGLQALRLTSELVGAFPRQGAAVNIDNRSITINGLSIDEMSEAQLDVLEGVITDD